MTVPLRLGIAGCGWIAGHVLVEKPVARTLTEGQKRTPTPGELGDGTTAQFQGSE